MTTHEITVDDMVCEGCVAALRQTLTAVDPEAHIRVSLAEHRLSIDSSLPRETLLVEIANAGYTPR